MTGSTWYLPLATVLNSVSLPSITSLGGLAAAHVVDEARELAADRHAQDLVVVGHVEIDRRLAGIGRRRDPQIGDDRRRRREGRREGGRHAIGCASRRPRRRPRSGPAAARGAAPRCRTRRGPDAPALLLRPASRAASRRRCASHRAVAIGSVLPAARRVLHRDQRPVRHAAIQLEAADRASARTGQTKLRKRHQPRPTKPSARAASTPVWTQGSRPPNRSRWAAATNSATTASSGISRGHMPSQASASHAKPILRLNARRGDRSGFGGVHRVLSYA